MKNFYPIKRLFQNKKKIGNTIAVEQSNANYSYKDFYYMVVNLSKKILSIKKNPTVAIIGEKNILSYVSIFSVLLSGGTYIPISSSSPIKRIYKILSSAKIDLIICQNKQINLIKKKLSKKIFLTEDNLSNKRGNIKFKTSKSNKLAYIIFTSGSTGEPKGVCISRESLAHYVKWLNSNLGLKKGVKCSQFPEISFDLSVADIFGTLCSGGTLCPADTIYSKSFPGRFIRSKKINYLICVPSLIDVIKSSNDLNRKNLISLKEVFFCGEPLLRTHVTNLFQSKKNIKIINTYGPTEATVSCTFKKVGLKDLKGNINQSISIGSPISGMKIKLISGNKFSKNEGEIVIYGKQVAQGYLNKKENKNKFIFSKNKVAYFRTGDYVQIEKGEMFFKNRIDSQVKIKGHRIELDEITSNLIKYGIKKATTIVCFDKIISFYLDKKKVDSENIKKFLKKYIPQYMVPNYIFQIEEMPLNQNGKIDSKALLSIAKKKINE